MSIRIVTDSTSDLPPELAEAHGVSVVAQNVLFGDEELRDGVDIDADRFFERLPGEAALPTTSQASPGAFRDVYRRLRDEGATEILSLHVSGKLSGTLASARQGAQQVEGVRIEPVDSQLATLALGIGVLTAARAVADGASLDEARDAATDQFARTHVFFLVDTLEYLRRGGRIGRAQELVGGLLRFKPLLSLRDGEVIPVGRVRTKAKAVEELIARASALLPAERIGAMHAAAADEIDAVTARLRALDPDAEVVSGQIGPAIGVHTGPGMLGLAIVSPPSPQSRSKKQSASMSTPSRSSSSPKSTSGITTFRNNDEGYLAWVDQNPDGWVLNKDPAERPLKLHRADCPLICTPTGHRTTNGVTKFCSTDRDALEREARSRAELSLGCLTCSP